MKTSLKIRIDAVHERNDCGNVRNVTNEQNISVYKDTNERNISVYKDTNVLDIAV